MESPRQPNSDASTLQAESSTHETEMQQSPTYLKDQHFGVEFVRKASDYCCRHTGKNNEHFCLEKKSECKRNHVKTTTRKNLPDNVLVMMRYRKRGHSNAVIAAGDNDMDLSLRESLLHSKRSLSDWVSIATQFPPSSESNQSSPDDPDSRASLKTGTEEKSQTAKATANSVAPLVAEKQTKEMTVDSVMSSILKRPFDGYRGINREGGWWISLEESKILAMNEEWWTATETSITETPQKGAKQVPIPENKKLWLFETGKMHLGSWKSIQFGKGGKNCICELGYGITYVAKPPHRKGFCYVGEFFNGYAHGIGRSFWLPSSPVWRNNSLEGSQIKNPSDTTGDEPGLPCEYVGRFQNNRKHDGYGVATLKCGTKKIGAWFDDVIVAHEWYSGYNAYIASIEENGVDWWTHHHDLIAPLDISSPATRKSVRKSPPTPYFLRGDTKPRAVKRRKGKCTSARQRRTNQARKQAANRSSKQTASPSSGMGNTTQVVTANASPCPVPVNVTPDSTNAIDHCNSNLSPTSVQPRALLSLPDNTDARATNILPQNTASGIVASPNGSSFNNNCNIGYDNSNQSASIKKEDTECVATVLGRDAIGYNANPDEMQGYAKELNALGLHSVTMIVRFCESNDVDEWSWMKPFHKRAFKAWLETSQSEKSKATA